MIHSPRQHYRTTRMIGSWVSIIVVALLVSGTMMVTACGSSSNSSSPTIVDDNQAPTAIAGDDQNVASGAEVTLDGSRSSDPESTALSYSWTQTAGPDATLVGADSATPSFTAPTVTEDAILTFRLTVTDARGATGVARVSIAVSRIEPDDHLEQSESGPTPSESTDPHHISNSCSDEQQRAFRDQWFARQDNDDENVGEDDAKQPIDPAVLLANASPTANAGNHLTAVSGAMVTLDGSGSSDRESTTLEYAWHQISGPRVILDDATTARPTFAAPSLITESTTLAFRLAVADEIGKVDRDETRVTVMSSVQRQTGEGRTVHILRGHARPPYESNQGISGPSISTDGRLVVGINSGVDIFGIYNKPIARIWSAETGELLHVLNHGFPIPGGAKLSADGRFAITGGYCDVMLWDTATGERLRVWDRSLLDSMVLDGLGTTGVGLSARGHIAWASSSNCGLDEWLWDVTTDERLLSVLYEPHQDAKISWISPNGKLALTRSAEGSHIWDVATATKLRKINVSGIRALSADGGTGMAMSMTSVDVGVRNVRIVDTATGRGLCELRVDGSFFELALMSADGTRVWTVSDDGGIRFWDVAACQGPSLLGHHKTRHNLAISDDGRIALTVGDEDGLARLWSMETGDELHVLRGHEGVIQEAALSADGRIAVTTGDDKTARVWNVETGEQLHQLEDNHGGASVESVALSGDGSLALTGGDDLTARLWNADTGEQLHEFDGHRMEEDGQISSVLVAMSADGRRGLTGSKRRLLYRGNRDNRLWDTSTGKRLDWRFDGGFNMALSADGATLLTGHSHGRASLTVTSTNEPLRCFYGDFNAPMLDVSLDAEGRLALTASGDGKIRLWNAETGELLHHLQPQGAKVINKVLSTDNRVALSADGRFALTTGGDDQLARLWNTETGQELHALAHAGSVTDVALNHDGSLALTADANGTAWLWHWNAPEGRQLHALRGHEDIITSVALSTDGTTALTGSQDGTARLWEITIE